MAKVKSLDDLTWESQSYEDREKREFCNEYWLTRKREIKLTGTGEFKGNVLEINFNSVKIPNYTKASLPIEQKMLKVPKEIGVVIKTDGEIMYLKEKNEEIISQIIGCRDIDAFFVNLQYVDLFFPDIYLKSSDGKFFANYRNSKLKEISIADKFHLTVDDVVTEKREDGQRTCEIKKQYKIKVSDLITACEVYGHLKNSYILKNLDSEDLEILEKMLRDEIKEKLPEMTFEDGNFKEFANLKDRTPKNVFAVQKLYGHIPELNFEETVNMLETLDDATFEFWLCGLGNKINVRYSKKEIKFYVEEKISFEKMVELFKAIESLRKYGKISISTDDRKIHLEELSEEIIFHKGRMAIKDLKLLGKIGKIDKKVEMLINDRDRFAVDGNGKIGITKNNLKKYNLKDFETYIL